MRKANLLIWAMVICLCLLVASTAYSKKPPPPPPAPPDFIHYYGYAILCDGNPYMISGDGKGQYVDRELVEVKGSFKNKRGDKIEAWLKYDPANNKYNLLSFRCFMGKPELLWRSPRRVMINYDLATASQYSGNEAVANMLEYNVDGSRRYLNDGSAHFSIAKGWWSTGYEYPDKVWSALLVDKSDEGEELDPNAITQTSLWNLNEPDPPRYWTSLEGSSFGSEEDPHSHIGFFVFEDQLTFTAIESEAQYGTSVPITWEVKPAVPSNPVDICVRKIKPEHIIADAELPNDVMQYPPFEEDAQAIWNLPGGLPFRLIMSKYSLEGRTFPAPQRNNTIASTWGEMKSE